MCQDCNWIGQHTYLIGEKTGRGEGHAQGSLRTGLTDKASTPTQRQLRELSCPQRHLASGGCDHGQGRPQLLEPGEVQGVESGGGSRPPVLHQHTSRPPLPLYHLYNQQTLSQIPGLQSVPSLQVNPLEITKCTPSNVLSAKKPNNKQLC